MAVFDIITWADEKYRQQSYEINNEYFSIDTAEPEDVYDWVNHNRLMVSYALLNDHVEGFLNVMPLTREAGLLFEQNAIKEEDLTTDHILEPDMMHYAEYLYLPAIAVRHYQSYTARQCVAALMCSLAYILQHIYDPNRLKKIFANPTTFQGNRMIRKLGLKPVDHFKKKLTGSDMYHAAFEPASIEKLKAFEQRYARFIGYSSWVEKDWLDKLAARQAGRL